MMCCYLPRLLYKRYKGGTRGDSGQMDVCVNGVQAGRDANAHNLSSIMMAL